MASGVSQVTGTPPIPPPSAQSAAYDRYIQKQLKQTSWYVKMVDLFGGLMVMAAAVLGFLLLVALVDAWLFDLGSAGRLLAFIILLGFATIYLVVYVAPVIFRRLNPQYAARIIEESEPSLKNSLINFLTFRANRTAVHEVVYQALQERAASDLSHVPVDSAVDRTKLIRVGYVLAGVMLLCGLYKILSPKDPFQTFARIAAPLANIDRPSRVQITDVKPGDVEVFHGDVMHVSARIEGAHADDAITLLYSTADGQSVDQPVEMSSAGISFDYECTLPPGDAGIQQNLEYRVIAGDAASRRFRVTVLAAPTIVVEGVEYQYPEYTGRPDYTVERQGDMRALEGTRVTVRCRANHPIKAAYIELHPAVSKPADGSSASPAAPAESISMQSNGFEASGQFILQLESDRRTPHFASYRVRFITEDGHRNEKPIVHQIEVTPDLAPEIDILTPTRDVIEVPENGKARIEIRAIDPDYGLSKIALRGVSGDSEVLNQVLLNEPAGRLGQTVVSFDFQPRALGLRVGNEVQYWAVAEDNRTAPVRGGPEPNVTRTRPNYIIHVVDSEESPAAPKGDPDSLPKTSTEEPPNADAGNRDTSNASSGGERRSEPAPAGTSSANDDSSTGAQSGAKSGQTDGSAAEPGNTSDSGANEQGEKGRSQSGGPNAEQAARDSPSTSSSGTPNDGQSDSPAASSERSAQDGASGDSGQSKEPLHPGEVFEKVLEHIHENNAGQQGTAASRDASDGNSSTDGPQPSGSPTNVGQRQEGSPQSGEQASGGQNDQPQKSASSGTEGQQGNAGSPQGHQPTGSQSSSEGGQSADGHPEGNQKKQDGSGRQQSGNQTSGGMNPRPGGSPQSSAQSGSQSGGGQPKPDGQKSGGQASDGQSGGGQQSNDKDGAPQAQGANRDRGQSPSPGGGGQQQNDGTKSPSTSPFKSGSEGQNQGDRSGGGGAGGGQSGGQSGNDSSGSNSPSDQGGRAASEPAGTEQSNQRGTDVTAGGKTGTSGSQLGEGSKSLSSPTGNQPAPSPTSEPGRKQGGPFGGGGGEGDTPMSEKRADGEIPLGDAANLDYARRATDLALEYLRDQKEDPDRKLLEKLNWTDDELSQFIERWDALKRNAKDDAIGGGRKLDEALRSLGLRPDRDQRRSGGAPDDRFTEHGDAGPASRPPAKYLERFDAFLKGTARVDDQ